MVTIPQSLQAQRPQRPLTVSEQELIRRYGSVQAGQLNQQAQTYINKINSGEINDINQIPPEVRAVLDIPQNYFEQQQQYGKINDAYQEVNRAVNRALNSNLVVRASDIRRARESFQRAGLDPNEAENLIFQSIKEGTGRGILKQAYDAKGSIGVNTKAQYQGPIKPGTSESYFRTTGRTGGVVYQGPIKPGTSEIQFRNTGVTGGVPDVKVQSNGVYTKPLLEYKPAPTTKEQIREIIKNQNPVSGLKNYAFSKIRGKAYQLESKYASRGQSLFGGETGEAVQQGATIGTYFIPYAGQALLFAESAGQFTSGGRAETNRISESVKEKYGISPIATKLGIYGLSTGIIGASTLSGASRLFGFPKYETRFLSKNIANAPNGQVIDSIALTTQENLLYSRNYLSGSRTIIRTIDKGEDSKSFLSGIYGEVKPLTIAGYPKKPTTFSSAIVGDIAKADVTLPLKQGGRFVVEEGYRVQGVGRQFSGDKSRSFLLGGYGGKLNDKKLFGLYQDVPLKKGEPQSRGVGYSLGITSRDVQAIDNTGFNIIGKPRTKTTTKPFKEKVENVAETRTKDIIESTIKAGETSTTIKTILPKTITGITGLLVGQNNLNRQNQEVKTRNVVNTIFGQATKQEQDVRLKQPAKVSLSNITSFGLKQPQRLKLLQAQAQPQAQKSQQRTRSIGMSTAPGSARGSITPIPRTITGGFFFPGEKSTYSQQQAYDSYVYRESIRGRPPFYQKINSIPLSKESALSLTAEEVDRSISARGVIRRAKDIITKNRQGKVINRESPQATNTGNTYYRDNRFKFYNPKAQPFQIIERRKYRADSAGEVQRLQRSRASALLMGSIKYKRRNNFRI